MTTESFILESSELSFLFLNFTLDLTESLSPPIIQKHFFLNICPRSHSFHLNPSPLLINLLYIYIFSPSYTCCLAKFNMAKQWDISCTCHLLEMSDIWNHLFPVAAKEQEIQLRMVIENRKLSLIVQAISQWNLRWNFCS